MKNQKREVAWQSVDLLNSLPTLGVFPETLPLGEGGRPRSADSKPRCIYFKKFSPTGAHRFWFILPFTIYIFFGKHFLAAKHRSTCWSLFGWTSGRTLELRPWQPRFVGLVSPSIPHSCQGKQAPAWRKQFSWYRGFVLMVFWPGRFSKKSLSNAQLWIWISWSVKFVALPEASGEKPGVRAYELVIEAWQTFGKVEGCRSIL